MKSLMIFGFRSRKIIERSNPWTMAQINLLTVSAPVTEFQMTPAASLPLHKSGKLVLKKRCLCGAEIIQKYKCKILAKVGEMDEHSLE